MTTLLKKNSMKFSKMPDEAAVIFHADGTETCFVSDEKSVEENSPTEKAFFVLWCLHKTEYLEEFRRELHKT
jgi:hypothetical protein